MRRLSDNRKAQAATAALITAIILLIPTPSFAIHINVPAAQSKGQRQVIISLPDRQLALVEDGKVLKTYSVAVGAEISHSPEGDFTVINRLENPTYYAPGKVIGPGKENPLGTRWMGLSKKGYGIHGTNVPSSIGKAASHGCIRMRQRDLEELFTLVRVGDKVLLRDEQMATLLTPVLSQPSDEPAVAMNADATVNASPALVTADGTRQ